MISIHSHAPVLPVIIPMLSAPMVALIGSRQRSWIVATTVSLFTFFVVVFLTLSIFKQGSAIHYLMGGWALPWGIALKIDAMSVLLLLIVTGTSSLALIAGGKSLHQEIEGEGQSLIFVAWLLALAGLCGILISADAFNIFVFMEMSSLASYILVSGGSNRRVLPAVFQYLIIGTLGATFYLIGVGLIYLMTGALNLEDIAVRIGGLTNLSPIVVALGFITVGLALKSAIFPLHIWLPNTYAYAPHVVTAFLAACSTKVSLYILIRFNLFVFYPNIDTYINFSYFLITLSLISMLVASVMAVFESHLKRLLAWSSVAQIGYITLSASLLSKEGVTASLLHIFNHALAKLAMFLSVACLAMSISRLEIICIGGIAKKMPWTMAAFLLSGLSLIGIPGTAGFISKWYLIQASLGSEYGSLLVASIVISSLISVIYVWRIIERAYFHKIKDEILMTEAPLSLLIPTWIAVFMNIYFGIFPDIPLTLSLMVGNIFSGIPK